MAIQQLFSVMAAFRLLVKRKESRRSGHAHTTIAAAAEDATRDVVRVVLRLAQAQNRCKANVRTF